MKAPSDADLARLARFEQLAQADPANDALAADGFDLALQLRDLGVAARFFDRLAAIDAQAPGTRFREGRLLLARGDFALAAATFEALRAEVGPGAAIDSQWAAACAATGDHEAAVALLLPYAEQRTLPPGPWSLLFNTLHRIQRFDVGVALAREARAAFASDAASLGAASLLALDANDLPLAASLAADALRLDGAQLEALVVAGFAALNESEHARAIALFKEATAASPGEPRAWSGLGFAQLAAGELGSAEQAFERSLAGNRAHAGTWHGLAWTFLAAKNLPRAQAAFEGALECDRNFAETHGGLALVAHLQGRSQAAEQALETALRLDKRSPTARYAQALMRGTPLDGYSKAAVEHILEAASERDSRLTARALFALARRDGKALS
jgi:tetratricopeptide (TPR) repeat protein